MNHTRTRRVFLPLGAAVLTGIAVPVAFASPASAHASTTYSGNGNDRGSVSDSHMTVSACDSVADGHGVTTHYQTNTGRQGSRNDPNGSEAGCGVSTLPSGERIVRYKVCTNDVICSPWQPA